MENLLWLFAVAIGPILLGGAIGYALWRRRQLSRLEKAAQKRKVEQLYKDDQADA